VLGSIDSDAYSKYRAPKWLAVSKLEKRQRRFSVANLSYSC
jgi:hypothetical protein